MLIRCWTQKQLLVSIAVTSILSLVGVLLSPNLAFTGVCLFFFNSARCLSIEVTYSYMPDMFASQHRTRAFLISDFFYGLATPMVGAVYYLISPWELTVGLYQLLPQIIVVFLLVFYCTDTPLEKVTQATPA